MRLTRYTDYAVRVLLYLAERPERHCPIAEMATALDVPYNHLTKVAHDLVKAGYLASIRGRSGGVRLSLPASEINMGVVIRRMECDFELADCGSCKLAGHCGLKGALNEALRAFLGVLDSYSLADLMAKAPAALRT